MVHSFIVSASEPGGTRRVVMANCRAQTGQGERDRVEKAAALHPNGHCCIAATGPHSEGQYRPSGNQRWKFMFGKLILPSLIIGLLWTSVARAESGIASVYTVAAKPRAASAQIPAK
jgi:hypothetical protein